MMVRALISASVMLAAAIGGAAAVGADPGQDQRFLALLDEKQIPAIDNIDGLIARAHEVCGEFDDGTAFRAVLDEEMNVMYGGDPDLHGKPDRVNTTAVRFITASVEAYCPVHRGELPG